MKYWSLYIKSQAITEAPNCVGTYTSREDADQALGVELEVWGDEPDEYEIVEVVVPLSPRR